MMYLNESLPLTNLTPIFTIESVRQIIYLQVYTLHFAFQENDCSVNRLRNNSLLRLNFSNITRDR